MKRKLLFTWLILSFTSIAYSAFNEWNVWKSVDSATLAAGATTNFGPIYMASHEAEYLWLVYGVTGGDSLKTTLKVYGMMTPIVDDTLHMQLLFTTTDSRTGTAFVYADTLVNKELFPFLYGKITNNHADSSTVYDVFLHARPRDVQTQ